MIANIQNPYRFGAAAPVYWNDLSGTTSDSVSMSTLPEGTPREPCFSIDGTKCYVTGDTIDRCWQFSGTAWDLSTFTYDSKFFSFSSQTTQPFGVRWKTDGSKCFAVGRNNFTVWAYDAGTAWDVSTLVYNGENLVINNATAGFNSMDFSQDGTILIAYNVVGRTFEHYLLSTAWDVSTGVYDSAKSDLSNSIPAECIFMNPNGLQSYVIQSSDDILREYRLTSAWDFSTIQPQTSAIDLTATVPVATGMAFKLDGTKIYVTGAATNAVHQFSL